MANVVIIGSGPAGVSAALYTARAGMDTTVLTKGSGALARAEGIENYYGVPGPVSGAELERRGIEGAKAVGVTLRQVTGAALAPRGRAVSCGQPGLGHGGRRKRRR